MLNFKVDEGRRILAAVMRLPLIKMFYAVTVMVMV